MTEQINTNPDSSSDSGQEQEAAFNPTDELTQFVMDRTLISIQAADVIGSYEVDQRQRLVGTVIEMTSNEKGYPLSEGVGFRQQEIRLLEGDRSSKVIGRISVGAEGVSAKIAIGLKSFTQRPIKY